MFCKVLSYIIFVIILPFAYIYWLLSDLRDWYKDRKMNCDIHDECSVIHTPQTVRAYLIQCAVCGDRKPINTIDFKLTEEEMENAVCNECAHHELTQLMAYQVNKVFLDEAQKNRIRRATGVWLR